MIVSNKEELSAAIAAGGELNLYQKLLKIQKKIIGLGKDKSGPNGFYKYVTGDKLLSELKPQMNELGLLLKQEILSIENSRQDYLVGKEGKIKSEILSKVMMRFTWIDTYSGEKDENLFGANGQNDWEKGLGSALTYAERYFILKYFHIATDEDDIDNGYRKPLAEDDIEKPPKKIKPFLTIEDSKFDLIHKKISEGSYSMEDLEKVRSVSEPIKKILLGKYGK